MEQIGKSLQCEIACAVHDYESALKLGVRKPFAIDRYTSHEWIASHLNFSSDDLIAYLTERPEKVEEIFIKALDNHGVPNPFIAEVEDGYTVGWFDGKRTQQKWFADLLHASADYVRLFWGMSRVHGRAIADP